MAAKKKRAKKSGTANKQARGTVMVQLDADQILIINAAVEALSEFAAAIITHSDDPEVRDSAKKRPAKKSAAKSAKKRARKTT